jgi:hypothetical protein
MEKQSLYTTKVLYLYYLFERVLHLTCLLDFSSVNVIKCHRQISDSVCKMNIPLILSAKVVYYCCEEIFMNNNNNNNNFKHNLRRLV